MALSNFTIAPPQIEFQDINFDMNRSVPVILRLLEIDANLARMHAKLSPRMDEVLFWKNYFLRVAYRNNDILCRKRKRERNHIIYIQYVFMTTRVFHSLIHSNDIL